MYLTDWRFLITFLFVIFTNNENKILETIENLQTYLLHGSIKSNAFKMFMLLMTKNLFL